LLLALRTIVRPTFAKVIRRAPTVMLQNLFTYSLLQLYLNRKNLQTHTKRMIQTLRVEEQVGIDAVLVYSGQHYGVFDLDDYTA
jgi:hypothetical protein